VKPFGKKSGGDQCDGSEGCQNGQHRQIPACVPGTLEQFLVNRVGDRRGDWWYWRWCVHIGKMPNDQS